jgi:hypothetical protein
VSRPLWGSGSSFTPTVNGPQGDEKSWKTVHQTHLAVPWLPPSLSLRPRTRSILENPSSQGDPWWTSGEKFKGAPLGHCASSPSLASQSKAEDPEVGFPRGLQPLWWSCGRPGL